MLQLFTTVADAVAAVNRLAASSADRLERKRADESTLFSESSSAMLSLQASLPDLARPTALPDIRKRK